MKRIFVLACLSIIFCGQILAQSYPYCIDNRFSEQPTFSNVAVVSDYEVEYGFSNNWQFGQDTLHLDIHYPSKTIDPLAKRPLVVLIHGNDYLVKNKGYYTDYCIKLAERGFVAVTIDYRNGWSLPTVGGYCGGSSLSLYEAMYRSVQDAKAAIRFVLDKSAFYEIDEDYVFVGGNGVGAITALQVAFLEDSEVLSVYPSSVTSMGGINVGTNPIIKPFSVKGVLNWGGGLLDTNIIDANEQIPVLSMHGALDNVILADTGRLFNCSLSPYPKIYGSEAIYDYMSSIGVCNTANYKTNGSQQVFMGQYRNYTLEKSVCFMKNIMCGNCNSVEELDIQLVDCSDSKPLIVNGLKGLYNILISPNPTADKLNVELNIAGAKARIYSIMGRLIREQELQVGVNQLDVSDFEGGVYLLELRSGDERVLKKVLVE